MLFWPDALGEALNNTVTETQKEKVADNVALCEGKNDSDDLSEGDTVVLPESDDHNESDAICVKVVLGDPDATAEPMGDGDPEGDMEGDGTRLKV